MTAPYSPGQALAWLEPDPDGLRVHRASITDIAPSTEPGEWTITTDRGHTTVDTTGTSARAVPLDSEIETELYIHGDSYLVVPAVIELDRALDSDSTLDLGDDLGHG
jgi:hypothetical protein